MVSLKLHLGQMFSMLRSSHRMCSIKKLSLKNFAIFTGKHLCWSFFLIKLAWRHATLLKRDSNTKLKFFIKFLFFHQMIAIQKLWKMLFFISSEKLFFLFHLKSSFRDIHIFVFFPFLSTLSRFKRANGSGIIYDVMNWLA